MAEKKKKPAGSKLRSVYRLSLLRENTFEERFNVRLNPLNLIIFGVITFLLLVALVFASIAFTPLRELIPGYTDDYWKREAAVARKTTDSLLLAATEQRAWIEDLRIVLAGGDFSDTSKTDLLPTEPGELRFVPSKADSALRQKVAERERTAISFGSRGSSSESRLMFKPVEGVITNLFDAKTGHFGIDIAAPKNEVIKSALDGTVIMAAWTIRDGYVMQIQHANNFISVYKHNSVLLRETGDKVRAGDPVAIIGDSGELSDGPHLHFELWQDGIPVNPLLFLRYE
jgi:murein DD-endopeptidase MepM/ murein hydrolase activator NlpD